jgi:hypothetical protein
MSINGADAISRVRNGHDRQRSQVAIESPQAKLLHGRCGSPSGAPCGAAVEGANRPLRASDVFRGSAQKCHLPSLEIRCTLPGWEARAACRSGSGFLYALLIRAPFFFRRLLRSRVRRKNPQPEPVRMKKAVKRSLSRLSDGQACRALRTFPRSLRRQLPRWSALFLILGDFGVRGHAAIGEV